MKKATVEPVPTPTMLPSVTYSAAFSPDSLMLVTAAIDKPVRLWDMTRITQATANSAELPVLSNQIIFADWTTDGRLMIFVDAAGPVYIWGVGPADGA